MLNIASAQVNLNKLKDKVVSGTKEQINKTDTPNSSITEQERVPSVAGGKTLYVNKATGNNRNDGSKEKPLKNIQKAIDLAEPGTKILVAEGNYYGNLDCGFIEMKKYVSIYGGYSSDFSQRDILKHRTMVQPTAESNGTGSDKALLRIEARGNSNGVVVIDGLLFDKGQSNGYIARLQSTPEAAWPEGVETSRLVMAPAKGLKGEKCMELLQTKATAINAADAIVLTTSNPVISGDIEGSLTISNCVIANASNFAIQMSCFAGKITITNNVIINSRMAACEIRGGNAKPNMALVEYSYNTVLFAWGRLNDCADMGYGIRYMTGIDTDIHHNIIGGCTFSGIDRTLSDSDINKEKVRKTGAENNIFFLNKQADLTLPGGGMYQRIWAKDFADVEKLYKYEGNVELQNTAELTKAINPAYLKGYIGFSYSEATDHNPNSSANTFRSALGMPQQGTIKTKASMYANRYPFEDALKLFGAVRGYGAQVIAVK